MMHTRAERKMLPSGQPACGTSGSLSGGVKIEGPVDDLSVYGKNCKLNKFGFTIDFLNVPLTVDGPVAIDEKGVVLKNCMLTDSLGGTGRVNGGISYNKLKDMKVKVGVTMNNLLSLDTEEKDNEDFYGKVFSTGSVNINGDLRHLVLDVNARTERKSQLHIPLSGASSASNSNILITGESGTGKELVAHAMHNASSHILVGRGGIGLAEEGGSGVQRETRQVGVAHIAYEEVYLVTADLYERRTCAHAHHDKRRDVERMTSTEAVGHKLIYLLGGKPIERTIHVGTAHAREHHLLYVAELYTIVINILAEGSEQ